MGKASLVNVIRQSAFSLLLFVASSHREQLDIPLLDDTCIFPVGSSPGSVAIADLNSDGNQDIIVANKSSNDVTILLGIGSPSYRFFTVGRPVTSCR